MTLIAIQRQNDKVSFCSDSRISFPGNGYFDKGIKLFNVPFRIKGPAKSRDDFNKYEYELEYGLAVVGSSVNSYTVKDSIVELLPYVTYLTNLSDFSLPTLGSIVFKVYKEVSDELKQILRQNGLSEIILGGYCLFKKRIRVLRFYFEIKESEVEYKYEEILVEDGILFFGSGAKLAQSYYEMDGNLTPLQIIKKVIMSEKDNSVGGPLQYGAFYDKNFKISGVSETIIDKEGKVISSGKYRRGYKVENELSDALKPPYLFLSYGYMPVEVTNED